MIKTTIALLLAVAVLGVTGCNTIEGAGKDVQRAGEKVQSVVRDAKK
jgi:entericidin B